MKVRTLILFITISITGNAQIKREREYRIKTDAFPTKAYTTLKPYLDDVRRLRLYKEEDGAKQSFEAKFKKRRLTYSVEFDSKGVLEDVEFIIGKTDFPEETFYAIEVFLENTFDKYRIKKMQQQYLNKPPDTPNTMRNAFQNLLIPTLRYEFVVNGRSDGSWKSFEMVFDANGNHLSTRKILRRNYDHVLF